MALQAGRLPAGHPEGFIEAFANVYRDVAADVQARQAGASADALAAPAADHPRIEDGVRGVRFIGAVLRSARGTEKWTPLK